LSEVVEEAVATFVILPATVGVTTMEIVTAAPFDKFPRLHVMFPETWAHDPWLDDVDPYTDPLGSWSVRVTSLALSGPRFVTCTVYVRS
jgi:hypothetical protein